jgi:hypothetical protein
MGARPSSWLEEMYIKFEMDSEVGQSHSAFYNHELISRLKTG